jgi:anti-sigma factor RsiW
MTCREFVDFLMDYLGGELPADQRAEFEKHIRRCPPCVAFMKTYEETIRLGKSCCEHPDDPIPAKVPEDLVQAILAAKKKGE